MQRVEQAVRAAALREVGLEELHQPRARGRGSLLELHQRSGDGRMDHQTSPKQAQKIKDSYADTAQAKRLGRPKRWKCVPAVPTRHNGQHRPTVGLRN